MQKYLLSLIENHPEKTASEMRDALISKFENTIVESIADRSPDAAEDWIRSEAKAQLPGTSSVQKFIAEHKSDKPLPQDFPWTIGACDKFDIPADAIPLLIKIQQATIKQLTIRQARWFSRLYPIVKNLVKNEFRDLRIGLLGFILYFVLLLREEGEQKSLRDNLIKQLRELDIENNVEKSTFEAVELFLLVIIGLQYAEQEKINDRIYKKSYPNVPPPDTRELDNLYFVKQDVSAEAFLDGLWSAFATPEQKKQWTEYMVNFKGYSLDELEGQSGQKLSQNQVNIINEFLHAIYSGAIQAREYMKLHPKELAEIQKILEKKDNERTSEATK